jgi:hypothetical protein
MTFDPNDGGTLYHYTTAEGLQGIIKTKSIWASDYRFLNDATEFDYGLSIFDEIFEGFATRLPSEAVEVIKRTKEDYRRATFDIGTTLQIASFCGHGDLLSQWRGYSGAIGYAIGFNREWLHQNAQVQGFQLIPTCYEPPEQRRIITDKLHLLKKLLEERTEKESPKNTVLEWWPQFLMSIAACKNEHFKEEQEWRLVKFSDEWPEGMCTRPTRSGLVPYVSVKLNAKEINNPPLHPNNVGIERIIVAPGLADHQKKAVNALTASQHMRFIIQKSDIPYIPNV